MPYSKKWQTILSGPYGSPGSTVILARAQTYYDGFCLQYAAEKDRINRTNLKRCILPGISIYKALLDEIDDRQKVLGDVEVLFRAVFFTTLLQNIRVLDHLKNPFFIVRPVLKSMLKKEYLPGSQEIIEDGPDCFAVNIYRCLIFDTLAQHNANELTVLYCKTDDWLAEALPKINWERTKTLGRGNDCCDFCWCRIRE
jgi:hypothetical protein